MTSETSKPAPDLVGTRILGTTLGGGPGEITGQMDEWFEVEHDDGSWTEVREEELILDEEVEP